MLLVSTSRSGLPPHHHPPLTARRPHTKSLQNQLHTHQRLPLTHRRLPLTHRRLHTVGLAASRTHSTRQAASTVSPVLQRIPSPPRRPARPSVVSPLSLTLTPLLVLLRTFTTLLLHLTDHRLHLTVQRPHLMVHHPHRMDQRPRRTDLHPHLTDHRRHLTDHHLLPTDLPQGLSVP